MLKIDDRWINIEDAADYLGVNKDSIRNWIKRGTEIPAHKIGKQWKFKKSELDEWVKSGKSAIIDLKESTQEDHRNDRKDSIRIE